MREVGLILLSFIGVALGKPGIFSPLIATLTPGATIGPDGTVLDTPEVAAARAEHAAAQINERIRLANEAARTSGVQLQTVVGQPLVIGGGAVLLSAPIGVDGRVVDTPEVAVAKVAHATAQFNERINLANEAARSGGDSREVILPLLRPTLPPLPEAAIGPDGRVLDTPEVAAAKAAHAAAQVNERINLANEAARSGGGSLIVGDETVVPLVTNRVLVPGAPIGPDGRVQDTPEVAAAKAAHAAAHINEKLNLANQAAISADAIAVAGPGVAYGRALAY